MIRQQIRTLLPRWAAREPEATARLVPQAVARAVALKLAERPPQAEIRTRMNVRSSTYSTKSSG
jgi:hypothetical protein